MTKVNKYNLTIKGLKAAAGDTKGLTGYYSGRYIQISYDKRTGDVLTDYHCSFGQNSWTEYHDPDVITVGNTSVPMTMQEIADEIKTAVSYSEAAANF